MFRQKHIFPLFSVFNYPPPLHLLFLQFGAVVPSAFPSEIHIGMCHPLPRCRNKMGCRLVAFRFLACSVPALKACENVWEGEQIWCKDNLTTTATFTKSTPFANFRTLLLTINCLWQTAQLTGQYVTTWCLVIRAVIYSHS